MNRLISSIATVCSKYPVGEKWLIAPSLRAGNMWVEQLAKADTPAVNIRVKTLRGLALEIAGPEMASGGIELITKLQSELLLSNIWDSTGDAKGYLKRIEPDFAFFRKLAATIQNIRLAGLQPDDLLRVPLESDIKRKELADTLLSYNSELKKHGFIDYAGALGMACRKGRVEGLPGTELILLPENEKIGLDALESELLDSFQPGRVIYIQADNPVSKGSGEEARDCATPLGCVLSPSSATKHSGNCMVDFFRTAGEANEVREIFRRCMKDKIPMEKVEILYTDTRTYVPIIHELAGVFFEDHAPQSGRFAVTFAEGLPVMFTRPGRALSAWVEWQKSGFRQAILVRMIHDGLIADPDADKTHKFPSELAESLRSLPINYGRDNYLPKIDEKIQALKVQASRINTNGEEGLKRAAWHKEEFERLTWLKDCLQRLLSITPGEKGASGHDFIEAILQFLSKLATSSGELDAYALDALTDVCEGVLDMSDVGLCNSIPDLLRWAEELPSDLRIGGMGGIPGAAHASHVLSGGHTGRPYTFIVGLDETRTPAAGFQDPLLLDAERERISDRLGTSGSRAAQEEWQFAHTLAALRGNVTMSYTSRDIKEDRLLAPSPYLHGAYRAVSGEFDADLEDFLNVGSMKREASFAPGEGTNFGLSDILLNYFCDDPPASDRRETAAAFFPFLGHGLHASRSRADKGFTSFDGYVPAAGIDYDPFSADAMSPSSLESFAKCPMSYFFEKILGIRLPDELKYDPDIWLDPLRKGSLLHNVFRDFMLEKIESETPPDPEDESDLNRIEHLLDAALTKEKGIRPPPRRDIEDSVRSELKSACRIFLAAQSEFYRTGRPVYLETAIGVKNSGRTSPLDSKEPITMKLPGGRSIHLCGRIDRVDSINESGKRDFAVWDYKTGGSSKYSGNKKIFDGGRIVQHAIYLHIARKRLAEHAEAPADVKFFGYFFPGIKAEGEFIRYTPGQLSEAGCVIELLCKMLAAGAFLPSEKKDPCDFCDFSQICRETSESVENASNKLENPDSDALKHMREVRQWK